MKPSDEPTPTWFSLLVVGALVVIVLVLFALALQGCDRSDELIAEGVRVVLEEPPPAKRRRDGMFVCSGGEAAYATTDGIVLLVYCSEVDGGAPR